MGAKSKEAGFLDLNKIQLGELNSSRIVRS